MAVSLKPDTHPGLFGLKNLEMIKAQSKQTGAVEQKRYRPIVDAANVHMLAEVAFFDDDPLLGNQLD